ncbi:BTAD domain-containing putative transcriptional regulator [Streptoalloteichus hindustanus]|uniref:BTAD domain-containing putative transcriptional regulator n=1 Tax=Streptoalloteichus hindustanus TaxID=2017 RepID=UPI000936D0AB|nr:BTAD domain-containing putative transcriptional regulator [Streptoalloteichus hindustanus]
MRVQLLGRIRAYDTDGAPVEVGGIRLRTLLARLALDPGRVVPADSLIDRLWGDTPPADAVNALQALVSRLRRALGGPESVESVAGGYRLALGASDVDVHRFEELVARGRRELAADRPLRASASLDEALGLWRGAPLTDLSGSPFAEAAARLEELRVAAGEDRFDAALRLGRHAEVLADLEAAGRRHPLRERLAVLRMRALVAAGRQSDALAVYEDIRRVLAEELGVDPSEELRQTHVAVLRGEHGRRAVRSEPRLPVRLTSFVGRDDEVKLVLELMETARLVTIVGPGGGGKTRLAVEAVTQHRAYGGGRVWFVSLAGLDSPAGLADAVRGALRSADLRLPEGRPQPDDPFDQVVELLRGGEAVLVLDNCERLTADVAEFAYRLLDRLPHVNVLATSRESLGITGEALCRLGPLEVPATVERAPESAAVRLFVDRAAAVRPGFALDESTLGPVVDICRRLDGLPLALELAAARLRSMTVDQVARRLDDRFRLLTSGNRTALAHQRTLQAVIDWSWDLLSEPERALARRFSVFPGGADERAAAAVCSPDGSPYLLDSLVEKSLVELTADGRYRMLETMRAYAAEKLRHSGEWPAVGARFVRHFVELAEENEPLLRTRDQLRGYAIFDAEYDNLVFAFRSAVATGDADSSWRLLLALYWYWSIRFEPRSEELMAEVLELGDALPEDVRATINALHVLTNNRAWFPERETARALVEECVRTGAVDRFCVLVPVVVGAAFLYGLDDLAEHALHRAKHHRDRWARVCAFYVETVARVDRGDWQGALAARAVALEKAEEIGERYALSVTLFDAARAHSVDGEHRRAVATMERSSALVAELGGGEEIWHRTWLATERMRGGDLTGARREVDAARRLLNGEVRQHAELGFHRCVADLHRRLGEPELADRALDRLEEVAHELSVLPEAIAHLVVPARMANLITAGRAAEARELFPTVVEAVLALRDVAPAAELLARLLHLEGDPTGAATALGMSEAIRGAFDRGEPELTELVAELTERLGAPEYDEAYRRGAELSRDDALARLRA